MAELPPVTHDDLLKHPEHLRKMPNGGYAWKCGRCNQVASSLTQNGPRCYQHGGTRKRARDRLKSSQAQGAGKSYKPSGRPFKTGWYSRDETLDLHELVEAYRASGLNPDATDDDMLYLRARLQQLQNLEPSVEAVLGQLEQLLVGLEAWQGEMVADADGRTVAQVLDELGRFSQLATGIDKVAGAFKKFLQLEKAIEIRHERLIKLANIRADTRVKNKAGEQLDVFSLLLSRLMVVLQEGMPPEMFLALQRRMERDLNELPRRALEPMTVEVKAK